MLLRIKGESNAESIKIKTKNMVFENRRSN